MKTPKLNKSQLLEFEASNISIEYAQQNFANVTKQHTRELLGVRDAISERLKGTSLQGGWVDYAQSIFKPKQPRTSQGKLVKYESLTSPKLVEVKHPSGFRTETGVTYVCEGFKKAVAIAQETRCKTYAFNGLSHGIALAKDINALASENAEIRVLLDNDNTLGAINTARSFVATLHPDIKIGCFRGFKGIDDALASGLTFDSIPFVLAADWSANYAGYMTGRKYIFSSPQFENVALPHGMTMVLLLGGKGTGKTWFMEQTARRIALSLQKIFVITHRIVLSGANARRLGIPYIDDNDFTGGSVGLCIDSLLKVPLTDFIGATVFIDEIVQVIQHLLFASTLKHKRAAIIERLGVVLHTLHETGGQLVVGDADLDRKSILFLQKLGGIPDEKVFSIQNTFVFSKGIAYHTPGVPKLTKAGNLSERLCPADVVKKIRDEALAGRRLFCCLSAQKEEATYSTQTIEAYLIVSGVPESDICRIDSDTIGDQASKGYKAAERINQLCEQYRIILASPSINTGVDIQYPYFDWVVGIATGVLDADSVRQFLSRLRNWMIGRIFYAPDIKQDYQGHSITKASDLDLYIQAQQSALDCLEPDWSQQFDPQRETIIEATKDYFLTASQENLRDRFEYASRIKLGLQAEGFQVAAFESDCNPQEASEIYQALKACSESLTEQKYQSRQAAPIISEDDAKKLRSVVGLPKEEQYKLDAYTIREQLGVEPTPNVQKALFEGKKERLENQFAAFEGADISKQLWQKADYWAAKKQGVQEAASDFVFRNLRQVRIEALKKVSFFERIQLEFDNEEAKAIIGELLTDPLNSKIFNLPKEVGDHSVKTVAAIASKFNLTISKTKQSKDGTRLYKAASKGFKADGENLQQSIFEYWKEKRCKQVENWEQFKADFKRVKYAEILDNSKTLPALNIEDFKYAKLSTRARTMQMPVMPKVQMVATSNASEFCAWLKAQDKLALDIETYGEGKQGGLNHLYGKIRLIQAATREAIWVCEETNFKLIEDAIKACLSNDKQRKIGHNFMFDLRFLRQYFEVLALNCADTMLGSRCLLGDLGAAKITSHSLQQACENFLGIEVDKTEQKSNWSAELTQAQIDYAAKDPWLTFLLYERLEELTKKPSLLLLPFPDNMAYAAWEVENSFLFAAQQMEDTGYKIDTDLLTSTEAQYQAVRDNLMSQWVAPYKPSQKEKLRRFLNDKYGLKIASLGKATAAKHLNIPEIKLMQQICSCDAILKSLSNINEQVSINHGRVKPVITILSGTGRTASGATKIEKCLINLQSLTTRVNPVLKEFKLPSVKALFRTNLIIDLPASHGRIASEESNDENHLKGYLDKSIDMHCITAEAVARAVFPGKGYTAQWIQANKDTDPIAKGLRDTAKNTYYGWLNGAGVLRIKEQISSNLQINADPTMCKAALDGLQSVFEKTTIYAKQKLKELEANQFVVNGVVCGWYQFGSTYLCWKLGLVGGDLKVPATKAFAGIWSRIESLAMKTACNRIAQKFEDRPEWMSKLQNFIHDEVNCEIGHPDAAKFAYAVVREEFGKVCPRTVVGFDSFEKCITWKQPVLDAEGNPVFDVEGNKVVTKEPITNWSQK